MVNFKLALSVDGDTELSDFSARLYYYFSLISGMSEDNSFKICNSDIMKRYKCSESKVQRATRELVQKGYLIKNVQGSVESRKPNLYKLVDILKGVKNDTPIIDNVDIETTKGVKNAGKNDTPINNTIKNKLYNHNSIQSNVTILAQEETIEVTENVLNQNDNNDNSNNNLNLGLYNDTFSQDDNGNETDITPIEDNYNFSDTADTANTQSKPQKQNKATSEQNTIQNNKTYIPMTENTTQGNYDEIEKRYSDKPELMSDREIEFALNDTEDAINIVELNLKEGAHPNTDIPSYTRYINNRLEEVYDRSDFCHAHLSQRFAVLNNRWSELKHNFNLKANQITLPF